MTNPVDWALLDTNILVYATQQQNPHYLPSKHIRDLDFRGDAQLCLTPQVFSEFFSATTRTDKPALKQPLKVDEAKQEIRKYIDAEHIHLIYQTPSVWPRLLSLLEAHPVKGPQVYDLQLVATMLEKSVSKIYTYNRPLVLLAS